VGRKHSKVQWIWRTDLEAGFAPLWLRGHRYRKTSAGCTDTNNGSYTCSLIFEAVSCKVLSCKGFCALAWRSTVSGYLRPHARGHFAGCVCTYKYGQEDMESGSSERLKTLLSNQPRIELRAKPRTKGCCRATGCLLLVRHCGHHQKGLCMSDEQAHTIMCLPAVSQNIVSCAPLVSAVLGAGRGAKSQL
jgi:hypothetical protein